MLSLIASGQPKGNDQLLLSENISSVQNAWKHKSDLPWENIHYRFSVERVEITDCKRIVNG